MTRLRRRIGDFQKEMVEVFVSMIESPFALLTDANKRSLELYTVADSYKQMAGRTDADWLAEYKKSIRTHNIKKIVSATYELVSAAMFSYEQEVKLPPPSNPGYDFTVSHSGKTVRSFTRLSLQS